MDRAGTEDPIAAPPRAYVHPRVSPDGTRVAVSSADEEQDIWVWNLMRSTLTRLTSGSSTDVVPVWTPDSRRIVFSSTRGGEANLWWQAADGTGIAERLTTSPHTQYPGGISPDGTQVVFQEATATTGWDLLRVRLDGPRQIMSLVQTPFDERNGMVSPDGHWLAYESNSSGVLEIYVRPYPDTGSGQWQVSTAGGTRAVWARTGRELFFFGADGALERVSVEATAAMWNASSPTRLFEPRYFTGRGANRSRTYDISPDGRRFLMIKGASADIARPGLIVVQHWDEELKRLAPR